MAQGDRDRKRRHEQRDAVGQYERQIVAREAVCDPEREPDQEHRDAIFISVLAFDSEATREQAKPAISASFVATLIGVSGLYLRHRLARRGSRCAAGAEATRSST